MTRNFLCLLLLLSCYRLNAQKPIIDSSVFDKWSTPVVNKIAYSGRFISLSTKIGTQRKSFIFKIDTNEEIEIPSHIKLSFCANDSTVIFLTQTRQIRIYNLVSQEEQIISDVVEFWTDCDDNAKVLLYRLKGTLDAIHVVNLQSKIQRSFTNIAGFHFRKGNGILLVNKTSLSNKLLYFNSQDGELQEIWSGSEINDIVFNKDSSLFIFKGLSNSNLRGSSIYFCKFPILTVNKIVDSSELYSVPGYHFSNLMQVSYDDSIFYYTLTEYVRPKLITSDGTPDIWSYRDKQLQSLQQIKNKEQVPHSIIVTCNLFTKRMIQINDKNQIVSLPPLSNGFKDDFLLIFETKGDVDGESTWNRDGSYSVYLKSTRNSEVWKVGSALEKNISNSYQLSPNCKYLLFYSPEISGYKSLDLETRRVYELTSKNVGDWTSIQRADWALAANLPIGIASWIEGDSTVLVYDKFDIYKLTLNGLGKPQNITNGRKKNIIFRLAINGQDEIIRCSDTIILSAFSNDNFDEGYYKLILSNRNTCIRLIMSSHVYQGYPESLVIPYIKLRKARGVQLYIVRRMAVAEFPNFYYTYDFKTFLPISNVHPEREYNWLKSKLVKWDVQHYKQNKGVLYYPENFDPLKKYPLIIFYYERMAESLNYFRVPMASVGDINIPFFVSNGYIIFTPDIHYKVGSPGESVLATISSALDVLRKTGYIDMSRIALQGHSRGGWETNYLVTHSNAFAAAVSAAGMSEYISLPFSLNHLGSSRTASFEFGPQRIGKTLYDAPELYIKESPIFRIKSITTPLLLMSNEHDTDIPFTQGLSFFIGLRRARKTAWLIQYDGEDHTLTGNASIDYSLRTMQFFDHYLKGKPAPLWMTTEIPFNQKGLFPTMNLDKAGFCSATCKICQSYNRKN